MTETKQEYETLRQKYEAEIAKKTKKEMKKKRNLWSETEYFVNKAKSVGLKEHGILESVIKENGQSTSFVDNGYLYKRSSKTQETVTYRCANRTGCRVRVIRHIGSEIVRIRQGPNRCHSEACKIENLTGYQDDRRILNRMKEKVEAFMCDPTMTVGKIYDALIRMSLTNDEFKGLAFGRRQIEYWVRQARPTRNGANDYDRLAEVPNLVDGSRKMKWMRLNVTGKDGRMLFMSDEQLPKLIEATTWLVDGTFNSAPTGFNQVLNIMAVVPGQGGMQYVPCAHVLIRHKKKEDYRRAIGAVLDETRRGINLSMVIMDFEEALWLGVQAAFEDRKMKVRCRGCLFHFSQALLRAFRKMTKSPTKQQYKIVHLLMWAPYLHIDDTRRFVDGLAGRETGMKSFIHYFQRQWLNRYRMWVVDDISEDVLTNCAIESYHGRLKPKGARRSLSVEELSDYLFNLDHTILARIRHEDFFGIERARGQTKKDSFDQISGGLLLEMETIVKQLKEANNQVQTEVAVTKGVDLLWREGDQAPIADVPDYIGQLLSFSAIPGMSEPKD